MNMRETMNGLVCECVATARGHDGGVSCVVSDGEHLYTASVGNDIRMWELPDLSPCSSSTHQFANGGADPMCSVKAMVVARHRLFGAHQDHKIRVWSRRHLLTSAAPAEKPSHQLIATLPRFKDCLWKSLSQTNYVQLRRHHKKLWIQHSDTISALALGGTTQEVLYSASWDKTVKVWRLSDLKCMESIRAHDDAVNALAVCNKSGVLYTGSADGKVKVWGKQLALNAKRHSLLATMEGAHQKGASVNALAMSDGGEFLFSAGSDGTLAVWGREKGEEHVISKLLHKVAGCHAQSILCLCTCKLRQEEGGLRLLFSGSADKTARVWQITQDGCEGAISIACVGVLPGHTSAVKSMCIAPMSSSGSGSGSDQAAVKMMTDVMGRGCLVYTGSADKTIKAWWVSIQTTNLQPHPPQVT